MAHALRVQTGDDRHDTQRLGGALNDTKSFVYRHLSSLVFLNVLWFFVSLPLVTLGPSTLAYYAAVQSLREHGTVKWKSVFSILRRRGLAAAAIGLLPLLFLGTTVLYLRRAVLTGETLPLGLAVVGLVIVAHLGLVVLIALVQIAWDGSSTTALRNAYLVTVTHSTLALTTGVITLVIFVVTLSLTVGFVLLFATLAFPFHVFLVDELLVDSAEDPA